MRRARCAAACAVLWALAPQVLLAAPYVPDSDEIVLLSITDTAVELGMRGAAGQGADAGLTDMERVERARRYISEAIAEGSQEGFGYGEALLEPWHAAPADEVPAAAAILLAFVYQHDHRFPEALRLLGPVLARDPYDAQALLLRTQILLTTGAYAQVPADCKALAQRAGIALAANCFAQLYALTGHRGQARALIDGLLGQETFLTAGDARELRITQALLAAQGGEATEALASLRRLQAGQPRSPFLLQLLAAQLLAQGLYEEAVARIDALPPQRLTLDLQVSLLEGLHGAGAEPRAEALRERIAAIFAEAAARNEGFPYKEHARFLLLGGEDPQAALASARSNWEVQKDPDDLALLVSAALAAGSDATLEHARTWLRATMLDDARISALLAGAP